MFTNKKIFILGMARSGYEAAKLLSGMNNIIVLNDSKPQDISHVEELRKKGVDVIIGDYPLIDESFDYVIKNPGIKDNHPLIVMAKSLSIPVINEIEMAYNLLPKNITIIGVTGSNGKTTTTSILYDIIKNSGKSVILAGNIGYPLSSFIGKIKENDILLMEISLQQLCNFDKFKTDISVLTNIYDAHLDFVGSKERYIEIKKKIFSHHTKNDYAVLNYNCPDILNNINDINSTKLFFGSNENCICSLLNDYIIYNGKKYINTSDLKLKGNHNYENIMASIIVSKILGINDDSIIKTLKEFKSVEHRIEYVGTYDGVDVYNDSKSTNIKATQIALSSFNKPIILLLGGLDRGHSFDDLASYMKNVKLVISYGETKNRIKDFCILNNIKCLVCNDLKEATNLSKKESKEGDIILLSPACASWDQFKDFEERGKCFKKYIKTK